MVLTLGIEIVLKALQPLKQEDGMVTTAVKTIVSRLLSSSKQLAPKEKIVEEIATSASALHLANAYFSMLDTFSVNWTFFKFLIP